MSSLQASVIIPTYNREETIRRALESVYNQQTDNIEIIVVDGGSTDNTRSIAREVGDQREYQLRIINEGKPNGVGAARNRGIQAASAENIVFLDSDDTLIPHAISTLLNVLADEDADCAGVISAYNSVRNDGSLSPVSKPNGRITHADLCRDNVIGGFSGNLFRKRAIEAVGFLDESIPFGEDFDLHFRLTEQFYIRGIDESLSRRYSYDNQLTNNHAAIAEGKRRVLAKHGTDLAPPHRARWHYSIAHATAHQGNGYRANYHLRQCLQNDPSRFAYVYYFVATLLGSMGFQAAITLKRTVKAFTRREVH